MDWKRLVQFGLLGSSDLEQYAILAGTRFAPPVLRSYSLPDLPAADHFRVSVKSELNGIGSSFLGNRTQLGDLLDVSAPRGSFTLRPGQGPVGLLSAGVAQRSDIGRP